MVYLMKRGLPPDKAFKIMETVRKGKALKDPEKWEGFKAVMKEFDIPEWYVKSCEKIKYMFPKAHAAAYVTNAFRIAWFKVHMPLAYYAAYFTIRAKAFDAEFMINGKRVVSEKGSDELMPLWTDYNHRVFEIEYDVKKYLKKGENIFASDNLMYFLKNQPDTVTCENLSIFTTLDDTDIWVSMKSWSNHSDKVLATLSSGIINRNIFKIEISNEPILPENQNKKIQEIQERLNLNREDAEFLISEKMVSNHLYSKGEMGIDILYGNGDTKNISQASDMFNLDLLSKKVSKFYFCYIK